MWLPSEHSLISVITYGYKKAMCVCKNVALALTKMSFKVTCEKKSGGKKIIIIDIFLVKLIHFSNDFFSISSNNIDEYNLDKIYTSI